MHVTNELFNNTFTKKKETKVLTRDKKERSLSFKIHIGMNIEIIILTLGNFPPCKTIIQHAE